ncbi:hypothetical protein GCM10010384_48440 [Streptomyces djakartensis]|uniref:Uncharacterized protein n=1 Tax=Streptomyces djakartensis TaxID=68193 RepID=A0ABQ3A552_9ACTN|nr:hypothetical protein GCM10010384_48440 [Streptomyces djakartensis]
MLRRLLIQQASSELACTPFRTRGTAVSLLFSFPGSRTPDGWLLTQFLVQLHAGAVSVDNSRGVNPRAGAES